MDFDRVLHFLSDAQARGKAAVLVIVCAVEGSSMRGPGTIMGVAEDGSFAGSLSGGCIENAVVAEALEVITAGAPRMVRFGAGSPYLDIKLPCGGGLDLHFSLLGQSGLPGPCQHAIATRQPFSIEIHGGTAHFSEHWQPARFDAETQFGQFGYWPKPRIVIVGHGAGVEALASLATTMGCAAEALTPNESIAASLARLSIPAKRLERTTQTELLESDPWTGFVFYFHDHDWEIDLMARAFELPHFYLGAMGGRKAHAQRRHALRSKGITEEQLFTMRAPIGLFHSSRDPQTLALSTLAEVIRSFEETNFEAAVA